MDNNIKKLAYKWTTVDSKNVDVISNFYCQTRDVFQARLNLMLNYLLKNSIPEDDAFIIHSIASEIGNNSFDHNLGNWPDIMGVFFAYHIIGNKAEIYLADRGQGVFNTLKKVKSELNNGSEALQVAFTEKISGRAPENRGNGLKFVKNNIKDKKMNLIFISGNAKAKLNEKIAIKQIKNNLKGCLAIIKY